MSKNINQDKVDPKLLEILVCPVTKSDLQYDSKNNELISKQAGLAYPIRDGIPIMLEEEARKRAGKRAKALGAGTKSSTNEERKSRCRKS